MKFQNRIRLTVCSNDEDKQTIARRKIRSKIKKGYHVKKSERVSMENAYVYIYGSCRFFFKIFSTGKNLV